MFLGSTRAVADKLLRDVRRVTFGISLAVQILFLAYYGWSIYNSINSLPFLIIYGCLALVAVVSFINFLVVHKKTEKKNKVFNRILRISKYIINGVTLGLNAYQLFTATSRTDLQIILLGISGIFWLVNIVVEIFRVAVEYYFKLFEAAIRTDFAVVENTVNKVKELNERFEELKNHPKGNFWKSVDAPFEALANKLTNKPEKQPTVQTEVAPTVAEKTVQKLTDEYLENNEEEKQKKREENQQSDNEMVAEEKKQIKEHWQTIVNAVKEKMKPKKKK